MTNKIKENLYLQLSHLLDSKVLETQQEIESSTSSRDNDTKSSAGDKHETSRAMAQIEIDKLELQLGKSLQLQKELSSIKLHKLYHQVEFGSLVMTNHENYFISIGLGKLEFNGEIYYAISPASPIGNLLNGKKIGDKATLGNRDFIIQEIL